VTARAVAAPVLELVRDARALVFDFDGTLVDSNEIKWRGFEVTFAQFPDRLGEIMAYCRRHHHTPRGEKFRHVWEEILGRRYSAAIEHRLHARFAAATTRQVIEAPERPGAQGFLRQVTGNHVTAVLSTTPEETLVEILGARGWRDYFTLVRGAPVDKAGWLRGLKAERRMNEAEVVFFGDTAEDARAARDAACTFVAVGAGTGALGTPHGIADFRGLATS